MQLHDFHGAIRQHHRSHYDILTTQINQSRNKKPNLTRTKKGRRIGEHNPWGWFLRQALCSSVRWQQAMPPKDIASWTPSFSSSSHRKHIWQTVLSFTSTILCLNIFSDLLRKKGNSFFFFWKLTSCVYIGHRRIFHS